MLNNGIFKTRWGLNFVFLLFSFLILIPGVIGLYSLSGTIASNRGHIEAVDLAMDAQSLLQKQFLTWNSIVSSEKNSIQFRIFFHKFSSYSSKIQNSLFNIKLTAIDTSFIDDDIDRLINLHYKITREYMALLMKYKFSSQSIVIKKNEISNDRDKSLLKGIDNIVNKIKLEAEMVEYRSSKYYYKFILLSLIVFTLFSVILSLNISKKIFGIQSELERRVEERTADLTAAKKRVELSQKKYKKLVNGSTDVIFNMDEDYNLISYNNIINNYFVIETSNSKKINFLDFIYDDENSISKNLVIEKLNVFSKSGDDVTFKADFKTKIESESRKMMVKLHWIENRDEKEIIGEIIKLAEDELINHLAYERRKFIIGNSIILAEEISHRITKSLIKYLPLQQVNLIRIAVREIIINGIEHGNLNILFEEKSKAMIDDGYFHFIAKRQKDPRFKNKKVEIEYMIESDRVVYKITDEGDGFDYEKIMERGKKILSSTSLHGRGILMAVNIFDSVKYNDKGNQVMLVKEF